MATKHASLSTNIFPGYKFKLTAICPIVAGSSTAFAIIQNCHTRRAGNRLRLQGEHQIPIPSLNRRSGHRRILDLYLIPMASSPAASPDRTSVCSFESESKGVRDDETEAEAEARPMISGDSTYNGEDGRCSRNNSGKQQPRRRPAAKPGKPVRQKSFSQEIGHAAAETYLLTGLTITLLGYLGVGYRWISRLAALCLYAALLMPGFLQVAYYYFFSRQVRRSIVYGDQPRNRLDLYLPSTIDGPKPVVAFVTGGAWIIGYKAWGSLLGKQLAERGIIVACIDYRNFPQGTIEDMVTDASRGISFICNNIAEYGGDSNRIYLMGQSAGAHISACALLEQAIREAKGECTSWSASQIKAYFGLSGGYNLVNLVDHFHNRGLYRSLFLSIMGGEESLEQFSPEVRIQDPSFRDAVSLLPPIILFHGTSDNSIPSAASETFVDVLQYLGARAELVLFEGKTHTDLFLQDPLRGGKDALFDHLVAVIHADDEDGLAKDAVAPPRRRLVPEILLKLAGRISPF